MGVCAFVACGLSFDVDRYLETSPFKAKAVFRMADTSNPFPSRYHMNMGFQPTRLSVKV
jgi:hypothetical protein